MTKSETLRAYLTEPILSGLVLSILINWLGVRANAEFMHDEARDILSLGVVLLGASLALWIGLFWISSTDFGQWLDSRGMLEQINAAYVASAVIVLTACVICILCAHVPATDLWMQIPGEFFALWALTCTPTMLNNTRHLLRLHGLYGNQPRPVSEIKATHK